MNDPIFTITDLLPHLAQDQMKKKNWQMELMEKI